MAGRLERFAGADAFIFFTGGIGTLSEFAFIWHTMQLDTDFDRPLVCLSGGWKRVLAQIRLEQMIKYKYYRMLHLCGRAGDAVAVVSKDYTLKYTAANQRIDKRAVLFDLDGVLVESSEETFLRACENLGRFFRIQEVMAAFRQAGGLPAAGSPRPFYQSVFAQLKIEPCEVAELADAVSTMFAGLPPLYDDVVETLMKLKQQGFATGILSVRPLPQLREILAAHGLSRWIDQLYPLSDRLDGNSGGPTGWVLQAAGWSQGETVYIGDRCHENPPACALDAILLDRHLAHIGQDAVAVIRSLRELPFLLRRPEVATF
jgi:phosphoglycolate phosphatase-like HAD superfamily hydrolase